MSVRRAQAEIGSAEFSEWMAYAELEPFGPIREDERAGVVAAVTANVYRDAKRRREPFEAVDFFPRHPIDAAHAAEAQESQARLESDALKSKLMAWAAAMADNGQATPPKSEGRPRRESG
jgi:hypothetical protein